MELVLANLPKNAQVLDVGCFNGLKTVYYKIQRPDLEITAVDRCGLAIDAAKQKAIKYGVNINFQHTDFFDVSKDKQYDVVIATRVSTKTLASCQVI